MTLPPEIEEGNVEYKRKLTDIEPFREEQLTTQMKWRINEGEGEAIYYIGVNDDGSIYGLSNKEFGISIKNLSKLSKKINAKIYKLTKLFDNKKLYCKVKICFNKSNITDKEYYIGLLGNTLSGKSSLISV